MPRYPKGRDALAGGVFGGGGQEYYQRVKSLFGANLIAYNPLWEPVGTTGTGSVSDISGNSCTGTPANVTFGVTGIGDGRTAASFSGTNSKINIYTAVLAALFDGQEGGVSVWAKITPAALTDGANHVVAIIYANSSNYIEILKTTTNNQYLFDFHAGGVTKNVAATITDTDWMRLTVTWSLSNNRLTVYKNDAQIGTTQTGLGTWNGSGLSSTLCVIGAEGTALWWSGQVAHFMVTDREILPYEVPQHGWMT